MYDAENKLTKIYSLAMRKGIYRYNPKLTQKILKFRCDYFPVLSRSEKKQHIIINPLVFKWTHHMLLHNIIFMPLILLSLKSHFISFFIINNFKKQKRLPCLMITYW